MSEDARHHSCYTSIVREEFYPDEIDCISDDEDNHQVLSLCVDTSKQKITTQYQRDIITTDTSFDDEDENNTSSKDTGQNSHLLPPQFSYPVHKDQHFNRIKYRLPSPAPHRTANGQNHLSTALPRSSSHENFSHSSLQGKLTGDSGIGDSTDYLSTPPPHYEIVPIHGQDGAVAFMADRYEFDQSKIDEYIKRKRKNFLKSFFVKQPSPTIKTTLQTSEANTNTVKSLSTKSSSLFQRLRKTSQHSEIDEIFTVPIVRHHSSQYGRNENH